MNLWLSEVKNNSGKTTEETAVNVIFVDKEGKTIKKAEGTIPSLKKDETSDFMIDMDFDYSKVYDFNVEAKK